VLQGATTNAARWTMMRSKLHRGCIHPRRRTVVPLRHPQLRGLTTVPRRPPPPWMRRHAAAGIASLGSSRDQPAAQEEAATQEVPRSWTLFSQLELHSDAEKLRLASFLDRVQRQTAAESSTSLGQNTEEHEQQHAWGSDQLLRLAFERTGPSSAVTPVSCLPADESQPLVPDDAAALLARVLDGRRLVIGDVQRLLRDATTVRKA
jgi:hypothetical protein